jgi:hypothetical protein
VGNRAWLCVVSERAPAVTPVPAWLGGASVTTLNLTSAKSSRQDASSSRVLYLEALLEHDKAIQRITAMAGMSGAVITAIFGILHPKGSSDVGTLREWMTRVAESDIWVFVHFMLMVGSVLFLIATVGIARSYPEGSAAAWARVAFITNIVASGVAVMTFLIDGAVVKEIASLWEANPNDPATLGAARLATEAGFILVAGLQLSIGTVAFLFGLAGLATSAHPRWIAGVAIVAGITSVVPGAVHYLWGASTWSVSSVYVSTALFAIWVFVMSRRVWIHQGVTLPASELRSAGV